MDATRYRDVGGVSLVSGGALVVLGLVTAQSQYPGYSTTTQTISALGTASAPAASQAVFNATMVLTGALLLVAAYALHQVYARRALTGAAAGTALGIAGVGLFPAHTGLPHVVAAMVAFGGMGVTALVVAATVSSTFRYVSAVLGTLELLALVLFVTLGSATTLGVGGLERWVAYLGVLWTTAFGGSLFTGTGAHA
ncbi:DUF998 domain-containing protein [Halobacterium zhouii]|uniref:DUF998 domain-containing protein n=1 Tax=Halobacterium zhouii TaxID=2902624 RepID=UPI001E4E5453|nr:DUF998 domain-containing protein [Halobacterium zhouii]